MVGVIFCQCSLRGLSRVAGPLTSLISVYSNLFSVPVKGAT